MYKSLFVYAYIVIVTHGLQYLPVFVVGQARLLCQMARLMVIQRQSAYCFDSDSVHISVCLSDISTCTESQTGLRF